MKNLSSENKQGTNGKKKSLKKILIIIFICISILIMFLIYVNTLYIKPSTENRYSPISSLDQNGNAIDGSASPKSKEEILDELEKQQLIVTDKLSSNITFPTGDQGTIGDWIVENPSSNNIIQQAEVYFEDHLIAKSAPIYPNQHIEKIELIQNMHPGEFDAVAYINYYSIETSAFISRAGYSVHLTVK